LINQVLIPVFVLYSMMIGNILVGMILLLLHVKQHKILLTMIPTIRKQAEVKKELIATTKRYESFFQATTDAIYISSADYRVMYVNPAYENLFGWKREEVVGNHNPIHIKGHDKEREVVFNALVKRQSVSNYETKLQRKDGNIIDVSITLSPILDSTGTLIEIAAIARDITERKKMEGHLKQQESLYRQLTENSSDIIALYNAQHENVYVSPSSERILGYTSKEYIDLKVEDVVHEEDLPAVLDCRKKATLGEAQSCVFRMKSKEGEYIWLESSSKPLLDEAGNLTQIQVTTRNIHHQKVYQELLQKSEERYRFIAEYSTDMIRIVSEGRNIQYASPSHTLKLGYDTEELIGKKLEDFIYSEDQEKVKQKFLDGTLKKQPGTVEFRLVMKNKQTLWVETNVVPLYDAGGEFIHYISASRDISERKHYEGKLKYMAYHDSLTGIPNRRLFYDRFSQSYKKAKRIRTKFALFVLDCDHFKRVNDTLGHDVGDLLLKGVVERIQRLIRDTDTFARLSGDEFAIILDDFHVIQDVEEVVKRIIDALQTPWNIRGNEIVVTFSIGISIYPDHGLDMDTLFAHADQALYLSKGKGKNQYHFYSKDMVQPECIKKL
jgi:diguanylate cyclase (GGDEF)-like protein/PAS domain S-box-containing protein